MYMYQRVTRSEVAVSVKRRYNVILADTAYSRDREKSKTLEHRKILRFFDLNLNPWRIEIWKWIGGKKTFLFLFEIHCSRGARCWRPLETSDILSYLHPTDIDSTQIYVKSCRVECVRSCAREREREREIDRLANRVKFDFLPL